MLSELTVRDLLLLDHLELRFEPGFNTLTGETGAGKSVLVGALKLVLGGKALPDQIRPGADQAEVEARFDLADSPELVARLLAAGVPASDELVVRRIVQSSGRSRAYLNGRLCALTELAAVAPLLADIASQHESVSLTDPSTHLGFLDSFGQLDELRASVATQVEQLHARSRHIDELEARQRSRAERDAFVRFQLSAIDAVHPVPGEMDELRAERTVLRSASRLGSAARRAADRLTEGDPSLSDELRTVMTELRAAAEIDETLGSVVESIEAAIANLDDAGRSLSRYAERVHDDPQRLDAVEERLFELERLLRLHGPTEAEVLAAADRLRRELHELESVDDDLAAQREAFEQALGKAAQDARTLSAGRTQVARKLAEAVSRELAGLAMGGARVEVAVAPLEGVRGELGVDGARLTPDGIDRVEFLIAPNKGIAPRPLRKIASGGELSRALLAIKRVLAEQGPAGLYVFDEVDSGVGGAVAETIGHALADIARHHQVLCITHLAPIAALANGHFVVEKSQGDAVATTTVTRVEGKARVREVARMLSGARITDAAIKTASELIEGGRAPTPRKAEKAASRRLIPGRSTP